MTFDINELNGYPMPTLPNMCGVVGREHYRLLQGISESSQLVFDVGTYRGYSALALAFGGSSVVSYDIEDHLDHRAKRIDVEYNIGDVLKDKRLFDADLILLDTYHDGTFENKFYEHIRRDYKGLLLLDDIHLNDQMRNFWASITERKEDLTEYGHYTGTGLVHFE